jgi:hypothetical protein
MAHYAKLSSNNIVIQVVVINEEDENGSEENGIAFCKALFNDPDGVWRKTSYNTTITVFIEAIGRLFYIKTIRQSQKA